MSSGRRWSELTSASSALNEHRELGMLNPVLAKHLSFDAILYTVDRLRFVHQLRFFMQIMSVVRFIMRIPDM